MKGHKYSRFAENDEIRLLLFRKRQETTNDVTFDDSILFCQLVHKRLSTLSYDLSDNYTALSYVWGDLSATCTLYIDGDSVQVTANLYAALKDIRTTETGFLQLWVDALCIDQLNTVEKGMQVAMMSKIFEMAQHTIIYLGPLTDLARLIFAWTHIPLSNRNTGRTDKETCLILKHAFEKDLLRRAWFTRVWVFQELVFLVILGYNVEDSEQDGTLSLIRWKRYLQSNLHQYFVRCNKLAFNSNRLRSWAKSMDKGQQYFSCYRRGKDLESPTLVT